MRLPTRAHPATLPSALPRSSQQRHYRPRSAAAVARSSSAWSWPVSLSARPESIRASSRTRGSARQHLGAHHRGGPVVLLGERDLRVGERRHLRQVGDHQHLLVGGQRREGTADRPSGRATDAGIDLVEDEGGHPRADDEPQGQHRASQLATGRRLGERGHGQPGVEGEQERHVVARIVVAHVEAHIGLGQGELVQPLAHRARRGPGRGRVAAAPTAAAATATSASAWARSASAAAARSAWLSSSTSRRDELVTHGEQLGEGGPGVAE